MTETAVNPTVEKKKKKKSFMSGKGMAFLSRLAKALMVPIAILPFAALINRIGSLLQTGVDINNPVVQYSGIWWFGRILQIPGSIVFDNLSLFFAIGIGFGLSEDFRGEAALAAAVAFLGLTVITGPDGLAFLFYSHVANYDQSSIDSVTKSVIDNVSALKPSGHVGPWIQNLGDVSADGVWVNDGTGNLVQMSYGSLNSFFTGKTSLLYFVAGWDMIPVYSSSAPIAPGNIMGYVLAPQVNYMLDVGVIGGIVSGGVVAFLYNRYRAVKIPQTLSFFGGRRFIPMLAIISVWVTGLVFAAIWPWCQKGLLLAGSFVAGQSNEAGRVLGFGLYSFFNRIVQPLGLHHIINTFLWFQFPISGPSLPDIAANGGISGVTDSIVFGDINAFQAGIVGSGIFQAGFFPLYMGGYVGIAIGLTLAAPKENRKAVGAFYASTGFVAFLTGIDEPILFSFIFIAPALFIINSLLVPIFGMIITVQHISMGFGFSAGLIDYLISIANGWQMAGYQSVAGDWQAASTSYQIMANPLWILVWSAVMGAIYVPIFYFTVKLMDIPTNGREKDAAGNFIVVKKQTAKGQEKYEIMVKAVLDIVKQENIEEITNCTTRLRLTVKDNKTNIDDNKLKEAGFAGVVRVGSKALQLIVGTDVENVAELLSLKTNIEKSAKVAENKTTVIKESKSTIVKNENKEEKKKLKNNIDKKDSKTNNVKKVNKNIETKKDNKSNKK